MGIFEFSRPENYSIISEEWQIFESVFPDTGAFKYISEKRTAYLDDNTYRILRLEKSKPDGSMSEKDFFDLLRSITVEPVYNKRHVYNYRKGSECFWVKLCMIEKDGRWLGFIKDMTATMQEIYFSESFSILDTVTKLNNREAFLEELRILSETRNIKSGCLATFHINGINQLNNILGLDNSKKCILCAARTIYHFKSDDIIIGSTPYHEFLVFFKNKTEKESLEIMRQIGEAVHEMTVTDDFGEVLIPGSDAHLTLNCGYGVYPDDSEDFNILVNYSGFALFEIHENTTGMIKKFERHTYEKEKEYYTDAQIFCKIIDDNLFEYHMQPIVDAKTGVVFGYEALMRTTGNKYLNPVQMLEIARKQKRLYDIEKKTFFNVMKILSDNIEMFKDKKLFINSIPDHLLNDEDFGELYRLYGDLIGKTVIEITEQADISEEFLEKLNKRKNLSGFQLAFDDYGTGFSNTANLIRCEPEFIKIDRSLIMNIDTDPKKRQLVGSVVNFAENNGIMTLAEGIETSAELSTVINLGVNLIQGYYTSRPKPFILYEISREVRDEILHVNSFRNNLSQPLCISEDLGVLELESVDSNVYNEILVRRSNVKVCGISGNVFDTGIFIDSGIDCVMTIKDVFISRKHSKPGISLGENTNLTLIAEGENTFNCVGIYVPASSSLTIIGDGSVSINADEDAPYGIGGSVNDSYGNISVDMSGTLSITVNGINTVAVGGGRNDSGSLINLVSGNIKILNTGKSCISVGNAEGNAIINIGEKCRLEIENSSIINVSVGSLKDSAVIASKGNVKIIGSGSSVLGIGVLESGTGNIDITAGEVDINFGAKYAFCIGTNGGNMKTRAEKSNIILTAGGVNAIGIGDCEGSGAVTLNNNNISIKLNGENIIDIGSPLGTVEKYGNNIISKINY